MHTGVAYLRGGVKRLLSSHKNLDKQETGTCPRASLCTGELRHRWGWGSGWRLPLGVAGFAIPALGLSAYLHYAWSVNLNGMFPDAVYPHGLFRFLPVYTRVAGGIGFVIGWIAGKNV